MKVLIESVVILSSIAISVVAGYFLYVFVEGIRLDLYCHEFREGLDCYQEGWVTFPVWLLSLIGGFIAVSSITIVSFSLADSRVRSSIITLAVGSVIAVPLTLLIGGPITLLATVLSGLAALLLVIRLTNQFSLYKSN